MSATILFKVFCIPLSLKT